MPSYEMLPLIFIEVDMILFKHNVLKMYLLNTHLSFHIKSFNYFILFICFIEQFVGSILYRFCKYHEKKLNLMQIHLHEVKILQIHNARPEFVKKYHGY